MIRVSLYEVYLYTCKRYGPKGLIGSFQSINMKNLSLLFEIRKNSVQVIPQIHQPKIGIIDQGLILQVIRRATSLNGSLFNTFISELLHLKLTQHILPLSICEPLSSWQTGSSRWGCRNVHPRDLCSHHWLYLGSPLSPLTWWGVWELNTWSSVEVTATWTCSKLDMTVDFRSPKWLFGHHNQQHCCISCRIFPVTIFWDLKCRTNILDSIIYKKAQQRIYLLCRLS